MKHLFATIILLSIFTMPCCAQFGILKNVLEKAKAAYDTNKAVRNAQKEHGNPKVKDVLKNNYTVDTASVEYKKKIEELQQQLYDSHPELKKIKEMQGDTAALRQYFEEKFSGMSQEDIVRKTYSDMGVDFNSKETQDSYMKAKKMSGMQFDPVFMKIMKEQRRPTEKEAAYLNETYGANVEYEGMEAYNDSIGVFANYDGVLKPMSVTKYVISEERPIPDFGQEGLKQYVEQFISSLKNPFAYKEIVDSTQNYMVFANRHADDRFKGKAKFSFYSNAETNVDELTVNELLNRKLSLFTFPIDPKDILIFKIRKGLNCRYMEYMYSIVRYQEKDLMDYISERLSGEGCFEALAQNKISVEEVYRAIDKMELQFKVEQLTSTILNNDNFVNTNEIPVSDKVRISSSSRKIGGHVTVLDLVIDAEPGEYAFIINNTEQEVHELSKGDESKHESLKFVKSSALIGGAFFFTIE